MAFPVSKSRSTLPRLQRRLSLDYHRLSLAWQARREKRGRALGLDRDGDLFIVDDGVRRLALPDVRMARAFGDGVWGRMEAVADKYRGDTGYVPRTGDIVIDIGAGIGEFALWCAEAGAQVTAFEPDPSAFACLQRNIAAQGDVRAFARALWKERADLRLHRSADIMHSSLIEDTGGATSTADVQAWPLDGMAEIVRLPVIDFMKVDGEGVEPEILAGGARTLRRTRVIAVDLGAAARRPNLAARVESILDAMNFRTLTHAHGETLLALNASMVGPFSNRVLDRPRS